MSFFKSVVPAMLAVAFLYSPAVALPGSASSKNLTSAVDPAVIQSLLGEPYVTIPQPIRQIFYHLPAADPDVMAFDEQNISTTLTRGQLLSIVASFTTSPSSALAGMVTVPVLVQVGQFDTLMSQRTVSNEDASYAASPSVTTQELPNQGHVLNLHPGNEEGWRYVEAWLDYRF